MTCITTLAKAVMIRATLRLKKHVQLISITTSRPNLPIFLQLGTLARRPHLIKTSQSTKKQLKAVKIRETIHQP